MRAKLAEAEEAIVQLQQQIRENAERAETEKQQAVDEAIAETERMMKGKRLEKIMEKADEKERAREEARQKRLDRIRSK